MSSLLDSLTPLTIASSKSIRENCIKVYAQIHQVEEDEAISFYEREAIYFNQAISESANLKKCSVISLYSAFLEIFMKGLSIAKGSAALAYLDAKYSKAHEGYVAALVIQAYGELLLRYKAGHLTHAYNPVVIYEKDDFSPETDEKGELIVRYKAEYPRTSNVITGAYIRLALPNRTFDYKWLLQDDIDRLAAASKRALKSENANALYSSNDGQIDPGFLCAKVIKHAFKTFPKLKTGNAILDDTFELTDANQTFESQPKEPTTDPQSVKVEDTF